MKLSFGVLLGSLAFTGFVACGGASTTTADGDSSLAGGPGTGASDSGGSSSTGGSSAGGTGTGGTGTGGTGTGGTQVLTCEGDGDCEALNDTCNVGACVAGKCKPVAANDFASCDDGLYCTEGDICFQGACVGNSKACADFDACNAGVCDEAQGGCVPVPANDGSLCDDGKYCTETDTCDGGQCVGAGSPCNATGGECQVASCDEDNDTCGFVAGNNGASCDDGNGCTSGTKCNNGACGGATSTITACGADDQCCPAGCAADADCLYWKSGVQQNVPVTDLAGWTECYSETYTTTTALSSVLAACSKANLMLACRPVGSATLTLAAMAPRADVLFECGTTANCTKQSNGVGWYYSSGYSWGFAPGGEAVNRDSCDYNEGAQTNADKRLCWHTQSSSISSGYRCGNNDLNGGTSWERIIYQAD
jgi:hypothetical protein